jgi:MinD superfamily P-loop ATPase
MIRLADAIVRVAEPYDLASLDYRRLLELVEGAGKLV